MSRLGLLPDEVVPFILELRALPGLVLEGIFTHFSVADSDTDYTRWQLRSSSPGVGSIGSGGPRHPARPRGQFGRRVDATGEPFRHGPTGHRLLWAASFTPVPCPPGFRPAMRFKTQIAQVKALPAGSYVGYGNTYQTLVRSGSPSSRSAMPTDSAGHHAIGGSVLVRGRRAPIVGRVSMDQTMIDVTAIPDVRQGDEVILIGEQGNERLTAEEVAEHLDRSTTRSSARSCPRPPRRVGPIFALRAGRSCQPRPSWPCLPRLPL